MNILSILKKRPNELMLIAVGLAFFLNPMIALFDLLPDFIGCALIMYALHRLSPVASDFENAFNYFKYMLFASAARLAVAMASATFDSVTMLSVSLILGLIEAGIAVAALGSLTEGMATLDLKFREGVTETVDLKGIGVTFMAARGFASMLPYITSVFDKDDELITGTEAASGSDYSAVLLLVNIVITVIFAVFFMNAVINAVGKPARDADFVSDIRAGLAEKSAKEPEFFIRKTMTFSLTLLAYASLFLIDIIGGLPVGGRNFLPDFGFGILTVWALYLLREHLERWRPAVISGLVYTLTSVVNFFVYNDFLSRHYYTDFDLLIIKFPTQYIVAVVFAAIETVSLCVFAYFTVKMLMPMATHFSIPSVPPEFIRLTAQTEKQRRNSLLLLRLYGIFLGVIALMGTALAATLQMFDVSYGDLNFPYLLTHIAVNIIFYAFASTVFLRMRAGVAKRYERPEDII